jgi:hypothetical protein
VAQYVVMPRTVFGIGISISSLLVIAGLALFMALGTSAGLALVILGFLGVVMTALFTALSG